jgi:hypothetical protein
MMTVNYSRLIWILIALVLLVYSVPAFSQGIVTGSISGIDFGSFSEVAWSFGNTFFNPNGNGETNSVFSGIDRRRLEVGGKIIF